MRFLSIPGIPIPEGSWIVLRGDMRKKMAKLRWWRNLKRNLSPWKNIVDRIELSNLKNEVVSYMDERSLDTDLRKAVEFHGHLCPGLAIGYRVAKYVKEHYPRSEDEELACIAENNSCSVDAVQELLGCTFGKGNLIYKDYGKQVFTFFSRSDSRGYEDLLKGDLSGSMDDLRARYFKGDLSEEEKKEFETMRSKVTHHIIDAVNEELLLVSEVEIPAPLRARIYPSLQCQECKEGFMEICGRTANGKTVCKECFQRMTS